MDDPQELLSLAKVSWKHPQTGVTQEYVLMEGATATIGRLPSNEICIPEQHVSRQHAVISYRDGIFMITDLGSANGTFVNDRQVTEPYPLASGDEIRLYVPTLIFSAAFEEDQQRAEEHGTLITTAAATGKGRIIITNGQQEGSTIPLMPPTMSVGRKTSNAKWDVCISDPSISRPHARFELSETVWVVFDEGSSNGTLVNGTPVSDTGRALRDGDIITFGTTLVLFRAG